MLPTRSERIKGFLFKNQSVKQTVAKNTFWLFGGESVSRLIKIVIVVYAARILGVDGWGIFSYAITLSGFFVIFADIGLNSLVVRETVQHPQTRDRYISTILLIKLLLTLTSALLIIVLAPEITRIEAAKPLFPIVATLLIFDSLREFGLSLNRAFERMELEAGVRTLTNFAIVGLGVLALIISPNPKSLAIGYLSGSIIGFLVTAWLLRKHFVDLFANFSRKLIYPILKATWPLALSGVLGGIMISTDILMLGWFGDATQLGLYSAAQRPMQFFYLIPVLVATAVFPALARLVKEQSSDKVRVVLEKGISATLLLGIPLVVGGVILARQIIALVFGVDYLLSTLTFQILLPTILIVFPAALIANAIFAYNKQHIFAIFMGAGALGNIILNIILIPAWGIVGAAIATVFSQVFTNFFFWMRMKQLNYFSILPYLKKMLLSTFVMSIVTFTLLALEINVLINISLSVIVYLLMLKLLKEPMLVEMKNILKI